MDKQNEDKKLLQIPSHPCLIVHCFFNFPEAALIDADSKHVFTVSVGFQSELES